MLETLRELLPETPTQIHECRNCGCTVDGETDNCPACGTESIASYTVE